MIHVRTSPPEYPLAPEHRGRGIDFYPVGADTTGPRYLLGNEGSETKSGHLGYILGDKESTQALLYILSGLRMLTLATLEFKMYG